MPQEPLLEIKTQGNQKRKWVGVYPQLFLSQTEHLYHAFHPDGKFDILEEYKLGKGRLADEDGKAQEGFKKLGKLLGQIKTLVCGRKATRISLVCERRELSVYLNQKGGDCLPADLLALFVVPEFEVP